MSFYVMPILFVRDMLTMKLLLNWRYSLMNYGQKTLSS